MAGGSQGQRAHLLPPGHGAFPLAAGLAGVFILADAFKETLGLRNERSARKMSVSRLFHCMSDSEESPGTGSVLS